MRAFAFTIFALFAFSTATILLSAASIAAGAPQQVIYRCGRGETVTVIYGSGWADVKVRDSSSRLNQMPSGSGARYSDGRWDWRTKGNSGTLIQGNRTLLAGCVAARGPAPASGPAALVWQNRRYTCANGLRVDAAYKGDIATVNFQGRRHVMHHTVSADGVRYAGDGLVWWTRGREAFLARGTGGVIASSCRY